MGNVGFQAMQAGYTINNIFVQIISFLGLGAYIAGLVVCIMNRGLSKAMIMCIVGFGGLIGVWVLQNLAGALGGFGSLGPEVMMIVTFFHTFIGLLGPISTGVLVWGLYQVFTDVKGRGRSKRGDDVRTPSKRRRDEDDEEEEEEQPAPRPKKPGSRDIQR